MVPGALVSRIDQNMTAATEPERKRDLKLGIINECCAPGLTMRAEVGDPGAARTLCREIKDTVHNQKPFF